jgi:hypothetical protein
MQERRGRHAREQPLDRTHSRARDAELQQCVEKRPVCGEATGEPNVRCNPPSIRSTLIELDVAGEPVTEKGKIGGRTIACERLQGMKSCTERPGGGQQAVGLIEVFLTDARDQKAKVTEFELAAGQVSISVFTARFWFRRGDNRSLAIRLDG